MLRSELFTSEGMKYDEQLRQTEDYDFFARYIHQLSIFNLSIPLIKYRNYPVQTKGAILKDRDQVADQVRTSLLKAWGIPYSNQEFLLHNSLTKLGETTMSANLDEIERWLCKLLEFNRQQPWFEQKALSQIIGERWYEACYHFPQPGFSRFNEYRKSELFHLYKPSSYKRAKLLIKTLKAAVL
jgi:hypothetical protein